MWVRQLDRRGWSVGKGKTYLRRFGNDGRYGDEYRRLIKAFQADQGLKQDGLLGPVTWAAAFTNPVTG
nr:peptidoglycan-binding domain-containing protein [Glycomyces amatae]